ncbi:glycolate oxidase subunit GlcD [Kroppenstedtia guangzhouensis]|uniref:Glycolate oxidase subunit GlcD n=1 Tax=Kroppenstedtia guangzhouensis TaxID=1274356 RepID=A0ABQ1GIA2_9BACL|nr:FAD-linked oxidase C-terminal domain-containing protein [Kroppenstedtia guangzhouensis]GGA44186.1 glycolate oxidase subunit GlcD [Kroppenstedtia guangzhouensis]
MITPEIQAELTAIVGEERFRTDPESRISHSYDATPMFQSLPDGVIYPASTGEVQKILRIASNYSIPVVGRGSGSNLSADTVPSKGGLVMVMTRMNRILELDRNNHTLTVQPGVYTQTIHDTVEKEGLFYPPDPSSMAISTIGGNIAECSGGLRGLKYGTTKDYVLGLEAVLANGEVIRTGGKLYKDVAGYDLTKLLVGSEGTLAIITEATLKLIPLPESRRAMVAHYTDLDAAARTVSRILSEGIIPCTLEFMDQKTIQVVEEYANIGLPKEMAAILLIEQDGPPAVVENDIHQIRKICQETGATHMEMAQTEAEGTRVLAARRNALAALARLRPTLILEDTTVPRSEIAPMVREINRIADKYQLNICTFGHAGDGNLHPTLLTDARDPEEIERAELAFSDIFAAAIRLGGTVTGEHGVGLAKAPYLEWKTGRIAIEVMKGIKKAFDPQGILNPGKIFADTLRTERVGD